MLSYWMIRYKQSNMMVVIVHINVKSDQPMRRGLSARTTRSSSVERPDCSNVENLIWAEVPVLREPGDLFALLMATRLINPARTASATERVASLPRLERASRLLAVAHRELFQTLDAAAQAGTGLDAPAIWAVLEHVGTREALARAAALVEELVPEDDGMAESAMRVVLGERYRTVRPFLALLGSSGSLAAATGGGKVLAAVRALPDLAARKVKVKPLQRSEIDEELVPPMWQRAVYANPGLAAGAVDRDAYVVCVLEQLPMPVECAVTPWRELPAEFGPLPSRPNNRHLTGEHYPLGRC